MSGSILAACTSRSIIYIVCTLFYPLYPMHSYTQNVAKVSEAACLQCQVLQRMAHVLAPCTQVTDAGLRHLAPHFRLTHLDLSYCLQLTDNGLDHIRGEHNRTAGQLEISSFARHAKTHLSWAAGPF